MTNMLLDVRNLCTYIYTRRGIIKAVDGVTFSLQRGETIGLVGESGCGKSMTCLSIMRLVPEPGGKIVGGEIIFDGEDLLKKSTDEMRRLRGNRIAMILQDPMASLNPALTIGRQISETLKVHRGLKGLGLLKKAIDLLRKVQISDPDRRLGVYPHQMSGGMRQRVAGAIAISCQPDLLLADEPTTSLDVTVQSQYLRLLKQIQRETDVGMIFVTHDLGIVAKICDRVMVMYAGQIIESGSTREIFTHPGHPYSIGLLRCLPSAKLGKKELATIEGQPPDLGNLAPGCSFGPRCEYRDEHCLGNRPILRQVGLQHFVSCWKADDNIMN